MTDRMDDPVYGIRDSKGHWRPPYPCAYAPLFRWPVKPGAILKWLFGWPGYLWPNHAVFVGLAFLTYYVLQPGLARCAVLRLDWIALMLLRNLILMCLVFGGLHFVLYMKKLHGTERKYHPDWQAKGDKKFLFGDQVRDNVFRSIVSGCTIWTAYEVLYMWAAANRWIPFLEIREHPFWFAAMLVLIPLWREIHFYLIHRLIHWPPLFRAIHRVHHWNYNPGPWAGMAMHPVEHILYLSVVLIHFVVPSHPVHFFLNSQLTALTPAMGHHGFEGPLFRGRFHTGSYFHYLHHKHVTCNYGEATVPLDRWFGSFFDGEGEYRLRKRG